MSKRLVLTLLLAAAMSVGMASAAFAQGVGQQVQQQVRAGLAPLKDFGASGAFTQAMGHQAMGHQAMGHQVMGHQAMGHQVQQQVRAGLAPLNGSGASAPLAQGGAQSAQGGVAQGGGTQLTQQARPQVFEAQLNPLNGSGASGSATLVRNGTTLTTIINSFGMAPNLPHAQHIHGMAQAISECPTLAASGADQLITTAEGQPAYGPIAVSFTTFGDTSPASGLAVDRFPVASAGGTVNYFRSLVAPAAVAANLGNFAIVQHGVDLNGNGEYDFAAAGASELDPSLPQEATIPANCGVINPR